MFPAALAVAGDVHIVGEVGRATAAARRRYLALQRRGKGEAAKWSARVRVKMASVPVLAAPARCAHGLGPLLDSTLP